MTEHFQEEEFACSHCGRCEIDPVLVLALEDLRTLIGNKPIIVNSGYRCPRHPIEAAKVVPGQHAKGNAVDIKVRGMSARELYTAAKQIPQFRGFGVDDEQGYIHVDIRRLPAKWCYRDGQTVPWYEPRETVDA